MSYPYHCHICQLPHLSIVHVHSLLQGLLNIPCILRKSEHENRTKHWGPGIITSTARLGDWRCSIWPLPLHLLGGLVPEIGAPLRILGRPPAFWQRSLHRWRCRDWNCIPHQHSVCKNRLIRHCMSEAPDLSFFGLFSHTPSSTDGDSRHIWSQVSTGKE